MLVGKECVMAYTDIRHVLKNSLENRAFMIKTNLEPESCSFLNILFIK